MSWDIGPIDIDIKLYNALYQFENSSVFEYPLSMLES